MTRTEHELDEAIGRGGMWLALIFGAFLLAAELLPSSAPVQSDACETGGNDGS